MPIDGVVVRNIVLDLDKKLKNGRVDKITQPETDEILINIRNNGENYRLLLSSSPVYPRAHLTRFNKQSPISAPMFCMILRKHLSGGRITGVEQFNLDRIVKIYIESYDELGNLSLKVLICEIMGRHSNIILVNENNNIIIDSIKHVSPEISSFRQVLPGLAYKYPPMHDKLEPLSFEKHDFINRLDNSPPATKLLKLIINNINGFSSLSAREICYNAGLFEDMSTAELNGDLKQKLIDSTGEFIDSLLNAKFSPFIYYANSEPQDFYCFRLNHLNHLYAELKQDISETIESFYYNKDKIDRVRQKSSDILKVVSSNLDRCLKKLSIQEEKLLECEQKDKWKLYGDLIMSNIYNIKKGDTKADVVNFFIENPQNIEIPLDLMLSPVDNAQKYYKKYNKEKNAQHIVEKQKEENLEEIQYLENQLVNIGNCTEEEEIEEIRSELALTGYIKKKKKTASKKTVQSKPLHFVSSDGFEIYVGKNNIQNDYLTLKVADGLDIWMHTKNIPGSHVIIKADNKPVSDTAVVEAARFAAYYSKARNSSNVPVDYTERKNVKKPSGAKPGMVIYYTNKTVYVTPDEELIEKLKRP